MNTPICDFVKKYAERGALRLHMPGHKGVSFLGAEPLDITEIDGADVLYDSHGIIRESENNAAKLFGAGRTVYSTEGSSLSIRAMLYLALLYARETGKAPVIAAGRNAHKVFLTAAALLDFKIEWLYSNVSQNMIDCNITASGLDASLSAMSEPPCAVYITSPSYLGVTADISALADVCHRHGALMLVDNAHGAYLNFLPESRHPMALGADMCADSAHKTLPVLTGGAYLHISKNAPAMFAEQAERAMAMFASTSPSYIIMQSIDAANRYIAEGYSKRLAACSEAVSKLCDALVNKGYDAYQNEPLKLTLSPKSYGYTGDELSAILFSQKAICEFSDPDFLVLMFTPELGCDVMSKIEKILLDIPKKSPILTSPPRAVISEAVMTPREAMFAPSETAKATDTTGRILADPNTSCPPAIPILMCGERISSDAIKAFEYYGITHVRVVK